MGEDGACWPITSLLCHGCLTCRDTSAVQTQLFLAAAPDALCRSAHASTELP
jgi:hypothetical protein